MERRARVRLELVGGQQPRVGGDGEPPPQGGLPGHEGADQRDPRVPLEAVGDHGVGRGPVARQVRDAALAVREPPRHRVVASSAVALAHVHRAGVVGDGPLGVPLLVEGNVVRAHGQLVPLGLQLPVAPEVPLEPHLVLELLGLGRDPEVVGADRAGEGVLVGHGLRAIGLDLDRARHRVVELDGRVVARADEPHRADGVPTIWAPLVGDGSLGPGHPGADTQVADRLRVTVRLGEDRHVHRERREPRSIRGRHGHELPGVCLHLDPAVLRLDLRGGRRLLAEVRHAAVAARERPHAEREQADAGPPRPAHHAGHRFEEIHHLPRSMPNPTRTAQKSAAARCRPAPVRGPPAARTSRDRVPAEPAPPASCDGSRGRARQRGAYHGRSTEDRP